MQLNQAFSSEETRVLPAHETGSALHHVLSQYLFLCEDAGSAQFGSTLLPDIEHAAGTKIFVDLYALYQELCDWYYQDLYEERAELDELFFNGICSPDMSLMYHMLGFAMDCQAGEFKYRIECQGPAFDLE